MAKSDSIRFDLILEDGTWLIDQSIKGGVNHIDGKTIRHRLKLTSFHRLPYLGVIWRSFWAKRKGGILVSPHDPASRA